MTDPLNGKNWEVLHGDCLDLLRYLPDGCVDCCVTSPPYYGLRDYGHDGQIGLEETPAAYVARIAAVFEEVRRVLKPEGTLWLNLGDSYASQGGKRDGEYVHTLDGGGATQRQAKGQRVAPPGVPPKNLLGIPWRVAFALQDAGWYLRQDIIWHKPNPMPESVTDRCTKAHEYVFLLTKSERYHYDAAAIAEPVTDSTIARVSQSGLDQQAGSDRVPGNTNGPMKAVVKKSGNKERKAASMRGVPVKDGGKPIGGVCGSVPWEGTTRNKRSVWTICSQPFKGAHFAVMPPALVDPCVLAGCPENGIVLDPFGGSGTVGVVALRHGRRALLCELNPQYVEEILRPRMDAAAAQPRLDFDEPPHAPTPKAVQGELF